MALYLFYYYTAIWQETNQPKCTTGYIAGQADKGLGWGKNKILAAKAALKSIPLIEDVRNRPTGKGAGSAYKGNYIKVIYYHSNEAVELAIALTKISELENELNELKINCPVLNPVENEPSSKRDTNAYSNNSLNAYNNNIEKKEVKEKDSDILEKDFNLFWEIYPRKVARKRALESWNKIDFSSILAEDIIKSVKDQSLSEQWQKEGGQFVPHPATWLNQERWTDQPAAPAYDPYDNLPTADEAFEQCSQLRGGVNYGVDPDSPEWNKGEGNKKPAD